MVDMYLELSIILLSIIAVLVVLILYIVRQTLALNREYDVQMKKKIDEENLWIDRRESDNNILDISNKLKNSKRDEAVNTEQMVTFTKRTESSESVPHVTKNGHHDHIHLSTHTHGHFHHLHHVHHVPSEEEHFYENTTSDANEYSEYCVPNCEPPVNNISN